MSEPGNSFGNVPLITNEEDLEALLAGSATDDANSDDFETGDNADGKDRKTATAKTGADDKDNDDDDPDDGKAAKKKDEKKNNSPFNQDTSDDDDDEDDKSSTDKKGDKKADKKDDADKSYRNMAEYINDKFQLGVNTEAIPDNITKEQEAEVISRMFEMAKEQTEEQMAQVQFINQLLADDEVRMVLEAKAKGLSLKDVAAEFSATTKGMSPDQLVFDDFKKRYPNLKEESIQKMIDGVKKSGEFDTIAEGIRQQREQEETLSAQQKEQALREQEAAAEKQRQQDLIAFQQKLGSVKNVYGVPLDDQMRAEIYAAATQRDKKTGMTYLDQALQSDEGIMLATLGLLHLEKLIGAKASIKANKKNKSFIDKVFDNADRLQSGSVASHDEEFDISAVNRF